MNWDDPSARFHLIERVGVAEYERLLAQHHQDSTWETTNGKTIRPVQTRFGRLWMVDGTGKAFATLEDARVYATEKDHLSSENGCHEDCPACQQEDR